MSRLLERPGYRFPLMVLAMLSLATGLPAGLHRMGWNLDAPTVRFAALHGPLMVCGFLGTLISLERAVALGRAWCYLAPLLTGAGAIALMADGGTFVGPGLITLGSLVLIVVFAVVLRLQFEPFALVMTAGAVAWSVGNVFWLSGWPVFDVVGWWMGFLVLTIAGERLELSRLLFHARGVQRAFLAAMGVLLVGLLLLPFTGDVGYRLIGAALLALAAWLARYDIARHTIRQDGLTRFIAWCLITGYVWLAAGGVLLLSYGVTVGGFAYDAALHAVLVGFVFSMIFGHAPIIFPSVLGVAVGYHPIFYLHLVLLHASLILRMGGNLAHAPDARLLGGVLNVLAVVTFLVLTVVVTARQSRQNER